MTDMNSELGGGGGGGGGRMRSPRSEKPQNLNGMTITESLKI